MAEKSGRKGHTSERIRQVDSIAVDLPVVGMVRLPEPGHLAYYGGLAVLAAFQLVEWPIALVLAAG
ncbi:MAG TPA: hypothetical protein VMU34_18950, partial [Mycobacterium sp.]|nr:hypothetical protein [Mycobacterium sp.]